jgi:hypothetical protein
MDIQGGRDAVKRMKEAGNDQGKVVEVPHAGVSIIPPDYILPRF